MTEGDRNCRSEGELAELSDEQLLAYVVAERDAGRPECAKRAVAILAFGYEPTIRYRVVARIPTEDVDDLVGTVLESVIRSAFDGRSIGEFKSWLRVITQRRIADYHGDRERKPPPGPLAGDVDDDDERWGVEPAVGDGTEAIALREIAARLLEARNPVHQHVIRLYGPNALGYMELSAAEAATAVAEAHATTMSEANVHQIWRRFRADFHDELGMGGS